MKLSAIIAPLVIAKVSHEIIMQTVLAWETEQNDALEKRRASDRDRQSRKRQGHVTSRDVTVTVSSHTRGDIKQNNLDISNNTKKDNSSPKPRVDMASFKAKLTHLLDEARLEAICTVRRKKGAAFSEHAGMLLAKALSACPDVLLAADEMILRNWTSVKPEWLESRNSRTTQPAPQREQSMAEFMRQRLERANNDAECENGTGVNANIHFLAPAARH